MNSLREKMNDKSGFTLVEIAIVMVIIGLLIGGVLKGQEMIKNAKIKRVVKTTDELRAAVYTYQDRFGYYPGDDPLATTHTGDATADPGDGDGMVEGAEDEDVFAHLASVGLISGSAASYAGGTFPTSPFGGEYYLAYDGAVDTTVAGNYITFEQIPVDVGMAIDTSMDDGANGTGSIQSPTAYTATGTLDLYFSL